MSISKEELKETMIEVLHDNRRIPDEVHSTHHKFVAEEIERRERRRQMWEKFRNSFIGTLATGIVAGLAWIGKLILEAFQNGNHPQP